MTCKIKSRQPTGTEKAERERPYSFIVRQFRGVTGTNLQGCVAKVTLTCYERDRGERGRWTASSPEIQEICICTTSIRLQWNTAESHRFAQRFWKGWRPGTFFWGEPGRRVIQKGMAEGRKYLSYVPCNFSQIPRALTEHIRRAAWHFPPVANHGCRRLFSHAPDRSSGRR